MENYYPKLAETVSKKTSKLIGLLTATLEDNTSINIEGRKYISHTIEGGIKLERCACQI